MLFCLNKCSKRRTIAILGGICFCLLLYKISLTYFVSNVQLIQKTQSDISLSNNHIETLQQRSPDNSLLYTFDERNQKTLPYDSGGDICKSYYEEIVTENHKFNMDTVLSVREKFYEMIKNTVKNTSGVGREVYSFEKQNNFSYKVILGKKMSCYDNIDLVIIVPTTIDHLPEREHIRQVNAKQTVKLAQQVKTFFLLGLAEGKLMQNALEEENVLYGDIIQYDFIDNYRNLTIKSQAMLHWSFTYCCRTKYILKVDDHFDVNIGKLLIFLKSYEKKGIISLQQMFIICINNLWRTALPGKNKNRKWHVTKEEYPYVKFPNYCSGEAYVLPIRTIYPLFQMSQRTKWLFLEDVFITGMSALALGVLHKKPPPNKYDILVNRRSRT